MKEYQHSFWPESLAPSRIIFHNDFDGICSASVLLMLFCNDKIEVSPVSYSAKTTWPTRNLSDAAIVDFLYHPSSLWWFDHHETTFIEDRWRDNYHNSQRHHWDTAYKSCPKLVIDAFSKFTDTRSVSQHFKEWCKWADIIDSAEYQDAEQAIFGVEPCIRINQALAIDNSNEIRVSLVHSILRHEDPYEVARSPKIKHAADQFRHMQSDVLAVAKKNFYKHFDIAVCNLLGTGTPYSRYVLFYISPGSRYGITAHRLSHGSKPFKLSMNKNPWSFSDMNYGIHVGELMREIGGGGRDVVGSANFATAEECRASLEQLKMQISKSRV